jgi:phosphotriesterase-related protein
MTRRDLLAGLLLAPRPVPRSVLVHEHLLVDFIGAAGASPARYDLEEAIRAARPKLEAIRALGCVRFLECTPNYLGRDPRLIRRLADLTGIDIWTNTGLYGAGNHKYLPEFTRTESAEQLARRWIEERSRGFDGVKPRFIKIGVNKGPLHALDRKLVEAAAIACRETGLTVASHTGDGAAAREQVEIFLSGKAPARKFVWVHAQNEKDHALHEQLARAGVWIEFDGIRERSAAWHKECVAFMASRKLLGRTLISQDSGWYRVGEPGGGDFRGYDYLYTDFLPSLDPEWIRPLMVDNPRRAFGR